MLHGQQNIKTSIPVGRYVWRITKKLLFTGLSCADDAHFLRNTTFRASWDE